MKKFLCILLALLMSLQLCMSTVFAASESSSESSRPAWVELSFVNNIDPNCTTLHGVYCDGAFFASPENIAKYAGGELLSSGMDSVRFAIMGREIVVSSDGRAVDQLYGGSSQRFKVPTVNWEGKLYISMLHLYRYLGIEISFADSADEPLHLYINRPYTIYDALMEYIPQAEQFYFGLDEVMADGLGSDIIKKAAALDAMLIHYDNEIMNYVFSTSTALDELFQDSLTAVVREEGADLVQDISAQASELSNKTAAGTGMADTLCKLANKAASAAGSDAFKVPGGVFDAISGSGMIAKACSIYFSTMQTYNQFENIPAEQAELLTNTLARCVSGSPVYESCPEIVNAAKTVQKRVSSTVGNTQEALYGACNKLISNVLADGKDLWLTGIFGYPYAAIAATMTICTAFAETDPVLGDFVSDEISLTQARGCSDVQEAARALFGTDYNDFTGHDFYYKDSEKALTAMEHVQSDVILLLKCAMASRRILMDTCFADEAEAVAMKDKMRSCAVMVNKFENARLLPAGDPKAPTDDDLRWIKDLSVLNNGGYAVSYKGSTYYWQYDSSYFTSDATIFANYEYYLSGSGTNRLICEKPDGSRETILSDTGHGKLFIYEDRIYWESTSGGYYSSDLELCEADINGGSVRVIGSGRLKGLDPETGSLLYSTGSTLLCYDTGDQTSSTLALGSRFVHACGGSVYYEEYDNISPNMDIYIVSLEKDAGEDFAPRLIVSTTGDTSGLEFPYGFNSFCAYTQILDGYLYISYGVYAGSALFFQGGSIARVKLDGSDFSILTGGPGTDTQDYFWVANTENGTELYYSTFADGGSQFYAMSMDSGDVRCISTSTIYDAAPVSPSGMIYPWDGNFCMHDPYSSKAQVLLSGAEISGLGYSSNLNMGHGDDLTDIGFASVVGDKLYFSLIESRRSPDSDMGWRVAYEMVKRAAYCKDLVTGETVKLFDF